MDYHETEMYSMDYERTHYILEWIPDKGADQEIVITDIYEWRSK